MIFIFPLNYYMWHVHFVDLANGHLRGIDVT